MMKLEVITIWFVIAIRKLECRTNIFRNMFCKVIWICMIPVKYIMSIVVNRRRMKIWPLCKTCVYVVSHGNAGDVMQVHVSIYCSYIPTTFLVWINSFNHNTYTSNAIWQKSATPLPIGSVNHRSLVGLTFDCCPAGPITYGLQRVISLAYT